MTSNYAFKPTAEQALGSSQPRVPRRLNAALAVNEGLIVNDGKRVDVGETDVRFVSGGHVVWKLDSRDIVVVGEYTNQSGPVVDDWFAVLVARGGEAMYTFPMTESWSCSALQEIGDLLGAKLEVGLANSVQFKSRVMWPLELKGKELLTFSEVPRGGIFGKMASVFPGIRAELSNEVYAFASRADS